MFKFSSARYNIYDHDKRQLQHKHLENHEQQLLQQNR